MQIIKLSATHSTNLYLKNLSVEGQLEDYTIVITEHQTQGRGQMGTSWYSEKGKNLTFSVFKITKNLAVGHQFAISMCAALAVYNSLSRFKVPDLAVKWPNDIMSGSKKICGILIENTFSGQKIKSSIIGIGLNVNQTNFTSVKRASSLKLICEQDFDVEELLDEILGELQQQFGLLSENGFDSFKMAYEKALFRKGAPSAFKSTDGTIFIGLIRGISSSGKLQVEVADSKVVEFGLKEITLLLN